MSPDYLTSDQIVETLKARKGTMPVEQFRREIEAKTGMEISYSHLVNILRWDSRTKRGRAPNECVLNFIGSSTESLYQIEKTVTMVRKGKGMGKGKRNGR
jgi:hypothetical protein